MKVTNYDRNGNLIEDMSKVHLIFEYNEKGKFVGWKQIKGEEEDENRFEEKEGIRN